MRDRRINVQTVVVESPRAIVGILTLASKRTESHEEQRYRMPKN
jgi:hypothetical protein